MEARALHIHFQFLFLYCFHCGKCQTHRSIERHRMTSTNPPSMSALHQSFPVWLFLIFSCMLGKPYSTELTPASLLRCNGLIKQPVSFNETPSFTPLKPLRTSRHETFLIPTGSLLPLLGSTFPQSGTRAALYGGPVSMSRFQNCPPTAHVFSSSFISFPFSSSLPSHLPPSPLLPFLIPPSLSSL